MRYHLIVHRFASRSEPAATRIGGRKEFDVAAARKMIREGKTLADIGQAQGLNPMTVHYRLKNLGLSYLLQDRQRKSERCARGGKAAVAKAGH